MASWPQCPNGCGPLQASDTCPACGYSSERTLNADGQPKFAVSGGHQ